MDDLSKALTKAISNLLEQNEKRLSDLQQIQVNYDKQVESLRVKVDSLETKCLELIEENVKLKHELTEEKIKIKHEFTEENAKIKREMTEENARIKQELTAENAKIKRELTEDISKIKLELTEENAQIRLELNNSKSHLKNIQEKEINVLNSVLEKHRHDIELCKGWANYISCIHKQIESLGEAREGMEKRLEEFDKSLTRLADQQIERHKPQFASLRKPSSMVKSPSTSLILNGGSNYNSMSRYRTQTLSSFDVEEDSELQDISDHAAHLTREVDALNDLQRSFEKNSLYSDD